MQKRTTFLVILTCAVIGNCIPPPHPAALAVHQQEELLPPHQKSTALRNPHLLQILELTSLLHHGESPVFQREADNVPRSEIYNILTHAGFIGRRKLLNQLPSKQSAHVQAYPVSHDSPFVFNSDALQYL